MKSNKNFSKKACAEIYMQAVGYYQLFKQWQEHGETDWAFSSAEYIAKCEAMVELLEVIHVETVGGGLNQNYKLNLKKRLDSFKILFEDSEADCED